MNILILGAGRVGTSLAEHLNKEEQNNITIIDNNNEKLEKLQERLDVNTVFGQASHPQTLMDAGCEKADLVIAVSRTDEMNILACRIAHQIGAKAKTVCRVHSQAYWENRKLIDRDGNSEVIIDSFISPQTLVTNYIVRLIETPGALQSIDFANGKLRLIVVKARTGGLLVNKKLLEIKRHLPSGVDARIVAIFRGKASINTDGHTIIQEYDEVFFIAEKKHIRLIMAELRRSEKPYKKVVIAGGGEIGYRLATKLEGTVSSIKLIDHNLETVEKISAKLPNAIVLYGNASDPQLMKSEQIDQSDIFISVTNSDESNILSSMLAKSLKSQKVMTLVNQPDYVPLLEQSQIDVAISPSQITISSILSLVRSGNTATAHRLRKGAAEAIEIVLSHKAPVIDKCLADIDIPSGVNIGALVRDNKCIIAHYDTVFRSGDHVIIFVSDICTVPKVQKLFK